MPQIMKSNALYTGTPQDTLEGVVHRAWVEGAADGTGEDKVLLLQGNPEQCSLRLLLQPVWSA